MSLSNLNSINKHNSFGKIIIRSKSTLGPILTKRQQLFGKYKPVKKFHKFTNLIVSNSGVNPESTFIHFSQSDIHKPYIKQKYIIEEDKFIPNNPPKWTLGCTYKCNEQNLLPKKDQFKIYNYSKKTENNNPIDIENKLNNNQKRYFPFLEMKKKFGLHSESKEWSPRIYNSISTCNKSAVDYNIITNECNNNNHKYELSEMIKNKRKKGIAEFGDYLRPSHPNFRKEYKQLLDNNNNIFKRYNGIFSLMYDSAAKNGNIYKPFKRGNTHEI